MRPVVLASCIVALLIMTSAGAVRSERGSQATFRAGVDLVTFAVTAVDRTGNPVADLTADDFEIVEDGRPQSLKYFTRGQAEGECTGRRVAESGIQGETSRREAPQPQGIFRAVQGNQVGRHAHPGETASCYPPSMSGAMPVRRTATYEDLCRVPDNMVAEILEGDLFASPRPALRHAYASSALIVEIFGPFGQGRGGPGGWSLLSEPEIHLRNDVVVPDLAGWRRTRLAAVPDAPYMTLAPDWVCEVLSPSTESIDRLRKLRIYAREGVGHVWLLNPIVRTLEILRLENGRWLVAVICGDDEVVAPEPFEAVPLELTRLWLDPPAETPRAHAP